MPLPADGWRWAPDGESIAYWQLDAEGIRCSTPKSARRTPLPAWVS